MWGKRTKEAVSDVLLKSFSDANMEIIDIHFNGECTKEEAHRIAEQAKNQGADVIVGIGGGKAIDTAKGSAAFLDVPSVIVPTIASNDAPTSAVTVWYNDAGEMVGYDLWKTNPTLIIVDTRVIANAPPRTFAAGIGDALATWLEASAAYKSRAIAVAGGTASMTALCLAKLCFETLMEFGFEALKAVQNKAVTPAVEKVVEATVLLSGIGWESGGLCCAHAIGNSLPMLHETHAYMHGEKVCLGIMTQLCLDQDTKTDDLYEIADFLVAAGLPVTFEDLGLKDVSTDRLMEYAKSVAGEGSFVHNHTFTVTAQDVYDAMLIADAVGRRRKALS